MKLEEKNDKTLKKEKSLPDMAKLIISALLAWLGCYVFTSRLGIASSIPVIVLTAAAASLICKNYLKIALFFVLFGFVLPFIASRGIAPSVLLCIASLIIFSLMYAAVYLFKKKGKIIFKVCSAFLLVFSVAIHFFFNSDPITFSKNSALINEYVNSEYKYEKLNKSNVYYDTNGKLFALEASYLKRPTEKALIYVSNGKIKDEYIPLTEGFLLEKSVLELTEKLRKAFPTGSFAVTAGSVLEYPRGMSVSAESTFDYTPYATYNIYFKSSLTASDFVRLSEQYYNAVENSGFKCRGLVFYAGSRGKYYAKIETRFISMKARFDDKVIKN